MAKADFMQELVTIQEKKSQDRTGFSSEYGIDKRGVKAKGRGEAWLDNY